MAPGDTLVESCAILTYLADAYQTEDQWYPRELRARAQVNALLHWFPATLRAGEAKLVFNKVTCPPAPAATAAVDTCLLPLRVRLISGTSPSRPPAA